MKQIKDHFRIRDENACDFCIFFDLVNEDEEPCSNCIHTNHDKIISYPESVNYMRNDYEKEIKRKEESECH